MTPGISPDFTAFGAPGLLHGRIIHPGGIGAVVPVCPLSASNSFNLVIMEPGFGGRNPLVGEAMLLLSKVNPVSQRVDFLSGVDSLAG